MGDGKAWVGANLWKYDGSAGGVKKAGEKMMQAWVRLMALLKVARLTA